MDVNEGAKGAQVLRVEFPDDVDLGDFELVEEYKPYRELCVPSALINARASVTLMSSDDVDELAREQWLARLGPELASRLPVLDEFGDQRES